MMSIKEATKDNYPTELIDEAVHKFFKMVEQMAFEEPTIKNRGEIVAFISSAVLNICSNLFCLAAENLDSTPEKMRSMFISALNKYRYEVNNTH